MRAVLLRSSLVVGLVGALVLSGPVSPASAVSYSPSAPVPINVLPSTVAHLGGDALTASPMFQRQAYFLYNAMQTPEFWQVANAQRAGADLVPAQRNVITTVQQRSRIPMGSIASVARGGGAMIAAEAGVMLGVGAVDLFWSDRQGSVCRNVGADPLGQLTALAARASCDFDSPEYASGFVPNSDVFDGIGLSICRPSDGVCIRYVGQAVYSTSSSWCFARDGGGTDRFRIYFRKLGGSWANVDTPYLASPPSHPSQAPCVNAGGRHQYEPSGSTTTTPAQLEDYEFCRVAVSGTGACAQPANPTQVPPEPTRTLNCVILGSDGVTYTGPPGQYVEGESFPTPRCSDLPEGVIPQSTWLESTYPGGPVERLWQQDTAPEVVTAYNAYPECRDFMCPTELYKGDINCHVSPGLCLNWFEDPNKTATYQCRYGPYAVTLGECNVYAEGFRAPSTTSTAPTNPDTLSDPATGEPIPSPFPSGRDAQTYENPARDASQPRQCFPTGWAALNPVEWVMRPVQCALEWAFVPRPEAVSELNARAESLFDRSVIGGALGALPTLLAPFESGQVGCTGPPWRIEAFGVDETFYPFNACDEPMAGAAAAVRGMLTATAAILTTLTVIRYAAATIGFVPFGSSSVADSSNETAARGSWSIRGSS